MSAFIDLIAKDLSLEQAHIDKIIRGSAYYYRTYFVDKSSGGQRRIQHPNPELKTLQYWCVHNIFSYLPVSNCAYAYIKRKSIKQNAFTHHNGRFILHLDITDFFESITSQHVKDVLVKNKGLFKNFDVVAALDEITRICLRRNHLCIGAVSSPMISNVIMYDFDNEMEQYCESKKLTYTRYADDIYVSSSEFIDKDVLNYFKTHLKRMNFFINMNKTRFMSSKNRKAVTGIVLTHDKKISVGLEMKKKVKSMIYNKMVKGIGESERIMGYLSYIKDIEPMYYNSLIIKYSKYGNVFEALK